VRSPKKKKSAVATQVATTAPRPAVSRIPPRKSAAPVTLAKQSATK